MPETAVDEHGKSFPREHDVGLSSTIEWEGPMQPEAMTTSVQLPPQSSFRARVASRCPTHPFAHAG
jgi:hypothetical protein